MGWHSPVLFLTYLYVIWSYTIELWKVQTQFKTFFLSNLRSLCLHSNFKNMAFVYYIEPVAFLRCYHAFFDWVSYPFDRNVTSCAMPNFFSSFISPPSHSLGQMEAYFCAMASYFQLRGGVSRFRNTHKDVEGEELCQQLNESSSLPLYVCVRGLQGKCWHLV